MFEKEEREKEDSSAFPKYLNSQHCEVGEICCVKPVWNLWESHFAIVLDDLQILNQKPVCAGIFSPIKINQSKHQLWNTVVVWDTVTF